MGAKSSLSVDMSKTYLYWAEHNLMHNEQSIKESAQHQFLQADVLDWLSKESENPKATFDVIFLDPPSFSTSKRMEGTLDIQRDHVALINQTMKLLNPGGTLVFSNNLRKFKLDTEALADLNIENITQKNDAKRFSKK